MVELSGIDSWLTERVTTEQAEKAFTPTPDQLARNPKMLNKPFSADNHRWESLKSRMNAGDELWYFCSPPETWRHLAGRAGVALVRDGKVIETLIVLMN